MKTFVLKNRRILPDDDDAVTAQPSIVWSAHDHKFPVKMQDANGVEAEKTMSCAEYYRDKYGISLQFPNMPVVWYVYHHCGTVHELVCYYFLFSNLLP